MALPWGGVWDRNWETVEAAGTPATLLRWKLDCWTLAAPPEALLLLVPEPPPPRDDVPSPTSSCPPNVLSLARFLPPSNCNSGPPLPLVPLPAPQKVDPSATAAAVAAVLGLESTCWAVAGKYPPPGGREEEFRVARMRRDATAAGRTAGPKYLRRAAWNALLEEVVEEMAEVEEVAADAIGGLSEAAEEERARPTAARVWGGRRIRASR